MLAVVAPINRVGTVLRPLEFGGRNELVVESRLTCHGDRHPAVVVRVTGAVGRDAQRAAPKDAGCGNRQIRAVDTTAERHDGRPQTAQQLVKALLLRCERIYSLG